MFLLVSVRHVGAHPDELQHGVSIQSSINSGKTFPRISRIRIIPSTQILARVFVYLLPFIFQILDFICPTVLVFILIYFEWRDNENQQFLVIRGGGVPSDSPNPDSRPYFRPIPIRQCKEVPGDFCVRKWTVSIMNLVIRDGAFPGIRSGGVSCGSPNPDARTYFRSIPVGQM